MADKKRTRSSDGALKRAAETARAGKPSSISRTDYIKDNDQAQVKSVFDYLSCGKENAIPLQRLAQLMGWSEREVRKAIEQERRSGALIVSNNNDGYWIAEDLAEVFQFARSMQHRANEILKTAEAVRKAAGSAWPL